MKALLIRTVLFFIGPAIRFEIERYRAMDAKRAEEATRHAVELSNFVDERMLILQNSGNESRTAEANSEKFDSAVKDVIAEQLRPGGMLFPRWREAPGRGL